MIIKHLKFVSTGKFRNLAIVLHPENQKMDIWTNHWTYRFGMLAIVAVTLNRILWRSFTQLSLMQVHSGLMAQTQVFHAMYQAMDSAVQ